MDINSRKIKFKMLRFFDKVDFSSKKLKINYQNPLGDTGSFEITAINTTDKTLNFEWLLNSEIASTYRKALIIVEFYEVSTENKVIYRWQTNPTGINIEKSLEIKHNAIPYDYILDKVFVDNNANYVQHDDMADSDTIIIIEGKKIMMPVLKDVIVTNDTMSQMITFKMQRFVDGMDLSTKTIAFAFENAKGESDYSNAANVYLTNDEIYFSWLVSSKTTVKDGLRIQIN